MNGMEECEKLESFTMKFGTCKDVNFLACFRNLTYVDLSGSHFLTDLNGLAPCTKLVDINLEGCYELDDMTVLSKFKELKSLNISGWHTFEDGILLRKFPNIDGLGGCTKLETLVMKYVNITNVTFLEYFNSLKYVDFFGCTFLADLDGLRCKNLVELILSGCACAKVNNNDE